MRIHNFFGQRQKPRYLQDLASTLKMTGMGLADKLIGTLKFIVSALQGLI